MKRQNKGRQNLPFATNVNLSANPQRGMQLWWNLAKITQTAVSQLMKENQRPSIHGSTIVPSTNTSACPEQLENAFREFVEATRELEVTQRKLSAEVHRLTEDLAKSNADLKAQMIAKATIAQDLARLISALPTAVIILQNRAVYAFNDVSARIIPGLQPGVIWHRPKVWAAIDDFHYRAKRFPSDDGDSSDLILRPESRQLDDGRELLLIHDVTATFRAREEAEREAKLASMGRMAAEIAHQLRTPLATAILYGCHLADTTIPHDTRFSFVSPLNQQLALLDRLVSRMMSFLRNKPGTPEMITVAELIDECCTSIEPLFVARQVILERSVHGGQHLFTAQRDQLRGGLVSLLENALHVSSANKRVYLRASVAQSRLTIDIEDEGPGIAPEILHRMFEPFATATPEGTGLGLAIAKSAFEAHRGQLQASNRPGGGAIFHIVLPVLEPL